MFGFGVRLHPASTSSCAGHVGPLDRLVHPVCPVPPSPPGSPPGGCRDRPGSELMASELDFVEPGVGIEPTTS